ncbi:putative alcohol dehydrogenase-like, NAD(P)-binding domain superfamily [Septoria linicola]|nr:putative alcohol dehydrogenase-like, NAD(P)-binding domain superfamily [Septoria linicola]
MGTGGVSCYAIQIASAIGATVIATSSSDEKLQVAKQLGAKHLINYRKTPDWATEVLTVTGGKGVSIFRSI